ncbi:MAG: dienelactone hydrolase family protein [Candidatus Eiseniibacteriota bacterium]
MNGRFEKLSVGDESVRLYVSGSAEPGMPGVVVFHPWWGLNDDVVAFADRLARAGFSVVAPDLVRGRTASTVEDAEAIATTVDEPHADAVALAAVDHLTPSGGSSGASSAAKIGAVGFSMGVPWAIWCAGKRPAVAASVVYYGTLQGPALASASIPVLGHFAEVDPFEPEENVSGFAKALKDAGRRVVLYRYPGTGHWFAEPSRDAFRPEAAHLAFERTVDFLREHVGAGVRAR